MMVRPYTAPRSLVFLCGIGAAAFYIWVLSAWHVVTFVSGLLSIFFMLYVFVSAMAFERAQRSEDADAIRDIHRLVNRCERAVDVMAGMVGSYPYDERAIVVLQQLGANMARFTSAYRRYLKDEAAADASEAEHATLLAQISGIENIEGYVAPMRERITRIRVGTRDVDDPRLVNARRRI